VLVRFCEVGGEKGEMGKTRDLGKRGLLGAGNWELPATRDGLHDDVRFFYAGGQELSLGAGKERFDNCWQMMGLVHMFVLVVGGEVG
jgi:hypothetical protein